MPSWLSVFAMVFKDPPCGQSRKSAARFGFLAIDPLAHTVLLNVVVTVASARCGTIQGAFQPHGSFSPSSFDVQRVHQSVDGQQYVACSSCCRFLGDATMRISEIEALERIAVSPRCEITACVIQRSTSKAAAFGSGMTACATNRDGPHPARTLPHRCCSDVFQESSLCIRVLLQFELILNRCGQLAIVETGVRANAFH